MLSVSRSASRDPAHHTRFSVYQPSSLFDLAVVVKTEVWSPIEFVNGYRGKSSFARSRLVALDFDTGETTLQDMLDFVGEHQISHVIGTTKSHQKEKVTRAGVVQPACDRFRVIFIADTWCTLREQFEYNMRDAITAFNCDQSCKDGARFYYPCSEIISVGKGEKWKWLGLPADYLTDDQQRERARARAAVHRAAGTLPAWLRDILDGRSEIEIGSRHKTCYKLGAQLSLHGWTVDEITRAVLLTPLAEIGEADVRRAIENGAGQA